MKLREYNRLRAKVAKATGRKLPKAPSAIHRDGDLTEQMFGRVILGGMGKFVGNNRKEYGIPVTKSGTIYTPDFIYPGPMIDGKSTIAVIEVKLHHYRSRKDERLIKSESRTKWEMAGDLHEEYDFVWAEYLKGGRWQIEVRLGDTQDRVLGYCRNQADFDNLLKGIVK